MNFLFGDRIWAAIRDEYRYGDKLTAIAVVIVYLGSTVSVVLDIVNFVYSNFFK